MSELELREKLARIDKLRAEAELCEKMHTDWMGHNGELVDIIEETRMVRRRWRGNAPQTIHSERVMPPAERDLFCSWLYDRARDLRAAADKLTEELEEGA